MSAQAKRAYEAWARLVCGPCPPSWGTLPERGQEAWRVAVEAALATPSRSETLTEMQVRLLEQVGTHKIGKAIKEMLPPDHGFLLMTISLGPSGNLSYISNVDREDAILLVREWIRHQRAL